MHIGFNKYLDKKVLVQATEGQIVINIQVGGREYLPSSGAGKGKQYNDNNEDINNSRNHSWQAWDQIFRTIGPTWV